MSNLDLFQSFATTSGKPIKSGNNAVIYTRVSSHSQEDNTSLESQKKFCDSFANKRGLNIVDYFGGTYESAKTDDRKEFNRMLSFVKRSKDITYIIVYSYERFSRSGINGASIADDLLKQYGVVTLAVTQELDPTTPSGSFQQNILFLFGQMDNALRTDKTVTGMREILRKGYYVHALPRGYSNLNKGKAVNQKIIVNEEGAVIRRAFHWKTEKKMANAEICRRLAKRGVDLDERRLSEILKNPFYCGIIVSKMLPNEVIQGKHEAMISQKTFLKINKIVAECRNHPVTHKLNDNNLPLKRFMRCGECDAPMTGFLVKKKGLYYYRCRTKGCKNVKSAKQLHETFSNIISSFKVDVHNTELIKKAVLTICEDIFAEEKENQKLLQGKLAEVENNIEAIEENHAIGKITDQVRNKYFAKYGKEKEGILEEIRKISLESSNPEKMANFVLKVCRKPLSIWKSSNIGEKSNLQNFMFPKGIIFNRNKGGVQTFRINGFFSLIPTIAKVLEKIKSGEKLSFEQISALVTSEGFKPSTATAVMWYSIQLNYEANLVCKYKNTN